MSDPRWRAPPSRAPSWQRRVALAVLLGLPVLAPQAHLLNMTTVQVNVAADGGVVVDLKIDLTRAAGGPLEYYQLSHTAAPLRTAQTRALLNRLASAIALRQGADPVIALEPSSIEFPAESREVFLDPLSWPMTHVVLRGRLPAQAPPNPLTAVFRPGFHFEEPIALTFMQLAEQRHMTRWLVTAQESPPFILTGMRVGRQQESGVVQSIPAPISLRQFVGFGFLHILPKGLDHVLFVLGLYLGARTLKSLLILVTCFTLAHSITLGLASIGIVRLSASIVEPLISASIVWVAVENFFLASRAERYRPLIVFGFGLLHGLGFAGALSALDGPQGSFLPSLLSFNVGIELGQLSVIAAALLLTARWRQRSWYPTRVVLPASLLIATIAAVWTVQRLP